jgi:hypothetical protein
MSPLSSGLKKGPSRNQHKVLAEGTLQASFSLGLFFDPEDTGDMFFRNVG